MMQTKSFQELLVDANAGDANAAYALANRYRLGEGVEQSETHAVEWYRKAAEQNHSSAQYFLGMAYTDGKGVQKDYVLGEKWLRKSAANGNPIAEGFLELCFEKEGGLKKRQTPSVKVLTETEKKCLEVLRFIREKRHTEAFKILEALDSEVASVDEGKSSGNSDPTETVHIGVDERWNQLYVKAIMLERENKIAQALTEARASGLIALERLGPEHVDFAASLNLLSELCFGIKQSEVAVAFARQALVIRFRNLGLWHSEVAECLHNIACFNSKLLTREPRAPHLTCHALALRIRVKVFGKSHPAVALSLVWLGLSYRARYDFKPALKCVRKGISIYEATIGSDHLMTQRARRALEGILNIEAKFNAIRKEANLPPLSDPI